MEKQEAVNTLHPGNPKCIEKIREELIDFRKFRAREEGIAAYYIYNNNQLEDIIAKLPKTKAELMSCDGFGPKKVEKYGDEIIKIIKGRL